MFLFDTTGMLSVKTYMITNVSFFLIWVITLIKYKSISNSL